MKKSFLATTGTFALVGALTGIAAFSGAAFASPALPATPPPAVTQSAAIPAQATSMVTPSAEETKGTDTDKDNVNYEEQGDHQGNNGTPEKAETAGQEKSDSEAGQSGPDTDNSQVEK